VSEMERRYDLFSHSGTRNIEGYNSHVKRHNEQNEEKQPLLPYIVVIVDELADLMMVASNDVEDAITRLAQMAEILAHVEDDFLVYSGDDGLTLPLLAIGGYGVVSVASHIAGNEMQRMVKAFLEGNLKQASYLHQQLLPLIRSLFAQPNPAPVKVALENKGVYCGELRLPLIPLTDHEKKDLLTVIEQFDLNVNHSI